MRSSSFDLPGTRVALIRLRLSPNASVPLFSSSPSTSTLIPRVAHNLASQMLDSVSDRPAQQPPDYIDPFGETQTTTVCGESNFVASAPTILETGLHAFSRLSRHKRPPWRRVDSAPPRPSPFTLLDSASMGVLFTNSIRVSDHLSHRVLRDLGIFHLPSRTHGLRFWYHHRCKLRMR